MKLLVVTSLAEHADKVAGMLTHSGVKVFSKTDTTGFKETHRPNLLDSCMVAPMENITPCSSFRSQQKRVHETCFRQLMNVI